MTTELKPRETTVILFQGDDLDPIAEKLAAVQMAAVKSSPRRIGDNQSLTEAQEAYDAFIEEAIERAVKVRLLQVGRHDWKALTKKFPPRDGNDEDAEFGFNVEEMGEELVPASIAAGQFTTPAKLEKFLDGLSDGDFSKLYSAAVKLNQAAGPDPKVRLSSSVDQTSEETSESPARLA